MLKFDVEEKRSFIIHIVYFLLIAFFAYFLIKYALVWLLPFIFSYLIASAAEPIIKKLVSRWKLNRHIACILSILLLFVFIFFAVVIIGSLLSVSVVALVDFLPTLYDSFLAQMKWISQQYDDLLFLLPDSVANYLISSTSSFVESLPDLLSSFSLPILTYIKDIAFKLPSYLVFFLITIAATLLLSFDFYNTKQFIKKQIPAVLRPAILESFAFFKLTVLRLIKAYCIICTITFIELNIGFFVLGIKQGLAIAALTAAVDIFPIVGCGTILIPWAIVSLLFGNIKLAISLAILYIIITSIRQVIEPKIVGDTIGLHPVAALFGIYLGLSFFGIFGMFIVPILMIILKNLQDKGFIRLWKS